MTVHVRRAEDLREDDRILLKDLRVLNVTTRPRYTAEDVVTVKYYQLAAQESGELVVPADQRVKIICDGWCSIDQELESLL